MNSARPQKPQNKSTGNFFRLISWTLSGLLLWNSVSWAAGYEKMSDLLTRSEWPSFGRLPEHKAESENFLKEWMPSQAQGEVRDYFLGRSDKPLIIHIQDAHANESAQKNIAYILHELSKKRKIDLVAVEGSHGTLAPNLFGIFSDFEVRRDVARYFVKQGRLTGAEYTAILDQPSWELFGAENPDLYDENRKSYFEILDFQQRSMKDQEVLDRILTSAVRFIFPENLQEMYRQKQAVEREPEKLMEYLSFLTQNAEKNEIPLSDYPALDAWRQIRVYEAIYDFKKIESIIGRLRRANPEILRSSEGYTDSCGKKRLDGVASLKIDSEECTAMGIYFEYQKKVKSLEAKLDENVRDIEGALRKKWIKTSEQEQLDVFLKSWEIIRRGWRVELSREDVTYFFGQRHFFSTGYVQEFLDSLYAHHSFSEPWPRSICGLFTDFSKVQRFYNLALKRDQGLIDNALTRLSEKKGKVAVVITGGFHTPGIRKKLRALGCNYLIIRPKMEGGSTQDSDNQLYQDALLEKPLSFQEQILRNFFKPLVSGASQLRYQLNARLLTPPNGRISELVNPSGSFPLASLFLVWLFYDSVFQNRNVSLTLNKMRSELRKIPLTEKEKNIFTRYFERASDNMTYSEFSASPQSAAGRLPDYQAIIRGGNMGSLVIEKFRTEVPFIRRSPWNKRASSKASLMLGTSSVEVFHDVPDIWIEQGVKRPIFKIRDKRNAVKPSLVVSQTVPVQTSETDKENKFEVLPSDFFDSKKEIKFDSPVINTDQWSAAVSGFWGAGAWISARSELRSRQVRLGIERLEGRDNPAPVMMDNDILKINLTGAGDENKTEPEHLRILENPDRLGTSAFVRPLSEVVHDPTTLNDASQINDILFSQVDGNGQTALWGSAENLGVSGSGRPILKGDDVSLLDSVWIGSGPDPREPRDQIEQTEHLAGGVHNADTPALFLGTSISPQSSVVWINGALTLAGVSSQTVQSEAVVNINKQGQIVKVEESYQLNGFNITETSTFVYDAGTGRLDSWEYSKYVNGAPVFLEKVESWNVQYGADGQITGYQGYRFVNGFMYEINTHFDIDSSGRVNWAVTNVKGPDGRESQEIVGYRYLGGDKVELSYYSEHDGRTAKQHIEHGDRPDQIKTVSIPDSKNHVVHIPDQNITNHGGKTVTVQAHVTKIQEQSSSTKESVKEVVKVETRTVSTEKVVVKEGSSSTRSGEKDTPKLPGLGPSETGLGIGDIGDEVDPLTGQKKEKKSDIDPEVPFPVPNKAGGGEVQPVNFLLGDENAGKKEDASKKTEPPQEAPLLLGQQPVKIPSFPFWGMLLPIFTSLLSLASWFGSLSRTGGRRNVSSGKSTSSLDKKKNADDEDIPIIYEGGIEGVPSINLGGLNLSGKDEAPVKAVLNPDEGHSDGLPFGEEIAEDAVAEHNDPLQNVLNIVREVPVVAGLSNAAAEYVSEMETLREKLLAKLKKKLSAPPTIEDHSRPISEPVPKVVTAPLLINTMPAESLLDGGREDIGDASEKGKVVTVSPQTELPNENVEEREDSKPQVRSWGVVRKKNAEGAKTRKWWFTVLFLGVLGVAAFVISARSLNQDISAKETALPSAKVIHVQPEKRIPHQELPAVEVRPAAGFVFANAVLAPEADGKDIALKGKEPVPVIPHESDKETNGFSVPAPVAGKYRFSPKLGEALKNLEKTGRKTSLLYVGEGTPLYEGVDEELELSLTKLNRDLRLLTENYERQRKISPDFRDPADFEGLGQKVLTLRLQKIRMLQRKALGNVNAPANGYLKIETLAGRNEILKEGSSEKEIPFVRLALGETLFGFVPANRAMVKLQFPVNDFRDYVLPSDFNFLIQAKMGDAEPFKAQTQVVYVEPFSEGTSFVHITVFFYFPKSPRGLPSHVTWEIPSIPKKLMPKGREIVVQARVQPRVLFDIAAPPLAGAWQPKVIEYSRFSPGDVIGGVDSGDILLAGLKGMDNFLTRAERWRKLSLPSSVAEGHRMGIPYTLGNDSYSKLVFDLDGNLNEADSIKALAKQTQVTANREGYYIPLPHLNGQSVVYGKVVGRGMPVHVTLTDIEVPRSMDGTAPVSVGDVVKIPVRNGEDYYLGEVRRIDPFPGPLAGRDRSRLIVLTEVVILNAPLFFADNSIRDIVIPDPAEQAELKKEIGKKKPGAEPVGRHVVWKQGGLPKSLANWLLTGNVSKTPGEDNSNFLKALYSQASPNERIVLIDRYFSRINQDILSKQMLEEMVLQGTFTDYPYREDVAEKAVGFLKENKRIPELIRILDKSSRNDRSSKGSSLAQRAVLDLLISDSKMISLVTEESRPVANHEFRVIAETFFLSLVKKKARDQEWNDPALLRVLRSPFWSNEELAALLLSDALDQETKNLIEKEVERRIGETIARHGQMGFPGQALKKDFGALVLYPDERDKIRMEETFIFRAGYLFFTSSSRWMDWRLYVYPAFKPEIEREVRRLKEQAGGHLPAAVPLRDIAPDPDFAVRFMSLDQPAGELYVKALSDSKKYDELDQLLGVSGVSESFQGLIVEALLNNHEGRFYLASRYATLKPDVENEKKIMELIESKDLFQRLNLDLTLLRQDETRQQAKELTAGWSDYHADSMTPAKRDVYLKAFLLRYSRAQGDGSESFRHVLLTVALRTLIQNEYELASLYNLSGQAEDINNSLKQLFLNAGVPQKSLEAAAKDQLERRVWLFSILLARDKYSFSADFLVIPGVNELNYQNMEQWVEKTQFDPVSFSEILEKALAEGKINTEAYNDILKNRNRLMDDFESRNHSVVTPKEAIGIMSWPLKLGLLILSVGYFLYYLIIGVRNFFRRLDYWSDILTVGKIRARATALIQHENLDKLGGNFTPWATLLQKDMLTDADDSTILNYARQNLIEGQLIKTADQKGRMSFSMVDAMKNADEQDLKGRLDDLVIFFQLIKLSLERFQMDAERLISELPAKTGADYDFTVIEIRRLLAQKKLLVQMGNASELLRTSISRLRALKVNYKYQFTRLIYPSDAWGYFASFVNRVLIFIYSAVRIFPLLLGPSAWIQKWVFYYDYKAYVKAVEKIFPEVMPENEIEEVRKNLHSAFQPEEEARFRFGVASSSQLSDFVSRVLFAVSIVSPLILFLPSFFWGFPIIVNWYGSIFFGIGAIFFVWGLWRHWLPTFHNWFVPLYGFHQSIMKSHRKQTKTLTKNILAIENKFGVISQIATPLLQLENEETRVSVNYEKENRGHPSVDFVIVIHSDLKDPVKRHKIYDLIRKYFPANTDGEPSIPILLIEPEMAGNGNAYLQAENYLMENYESLRAKYPHFPRKLSLANGIYLVPQEGIHAPLSVLTQSGNRPSFNPGADDDGFESSWEDMLIQGIKTLVLSSRQDNSAAGARKRGLRYVATESGMVFQGSAYPKGHLTVVGTFQNLVSILSQDRSVLDSPWEDDLHTFLQRPDGPTVRNDIKAKRSRLGRYQDAANSLSRQYSVYAGIYMLNFSDSEVEYYENYQAQVRLLYAKAKELSQRFKGKEHEFEFHAEDFLVGMTLGEESQRMDERLADKEMGAEGASEFAASQRGKQHRHQNKIPAGFVGIRTRNLPDELQAAYHDFFDIFEIQARQRREGVRKLQFQILQHTPPPQQGFSIDLTNPGVFFEYAQDGGLFSLPPAEVRSQLSSRGIKFNEKGIFISLEPWNIPVKKPLIISKVSLVKGTAEASSAYVFMGMQENIFNTRRPDKTILGNEIKIAMARLRDSSGTPYYSDKELAEMEAEDFPIFPKDSVHRESADAWLRILSSENTGAVILPISRNEWEKNHVTIRQVMENFGIAPKSEPKARAELRAESKTAKKTWDIQDLRERLERILKAQEQLHPSMRYLMPAHIKTIIELAENGTLPPPKELLEAVSYSSEGGMSLGEIDRSILELYFSPAGNIYTSMNPALYAATHAVQLVRKTVRIFALTPDRKLVVIRKYHKQPANRTYNVPGGHVKSGQDYIEAAEDEFRQELDLSKSFTLDRSRLVKLGNLGSAFPWEGKTNTVFIYHLTAEETREISEKAQALQAKKKEKKADKFFKYLEAQKKKGEGKGEVMKIELVDVSSLEDFISENRKRLSDSFNVLIRHSAIQRAITYTPRSELRYRFSKEIAEGLAEAADIKRQEHGVALAAWSLNEWNTRPVLFSTQLMEFFQSYDRMKIGEKGISPDQSFDFIFEYGKRDLTPFFFTQLISRMSPQSRLILTSDDGISASERKPLREKLDSMIRELSPGIRMRIKLLSDEWNTERYIRLRMRRVHASDIVWVSDSVHSGLSPDVESEIYLEAGQLTNRYLVVAGSSKKPVQGSSVLPLTRILAALRRVQASA